MKNDTPILEVKNLIVARSGIEVLNIPGLKILQGEVCSLIGPNGAGKSTLLMAMSYLFKDFSGNIFFKGREIGKDMTPLEYRRHISMVFQEPLLFDGTVFENVASGLKFRRLDRKKIENAVLENLERFHIAHLRSRHARTLSGGEAQRVSLSRAFAVKPEILFLDEPFSSLDMPTKDGLIYDLECATKEKNITVIFATHDRDESLRLSDRIVVINQGRIVQDGSPYEVMNYPCNEFVASFVGIETVLTGVVVKKENGTLIVSASGVKIEAVGDCLPGSKVILCIKPEDIILCPISSEVLTSARNTFAGTIIRIFPSGFYQKIHLDCGFPLVAYITNTSAKSLEISEGKKIKASFKATSVHVIKT